MTEMLYREDPYLREAPARVSHLTAEGGIVLDRTVFYPTGGGQPGDSGWIAWDGKRLPIAAAIKGEGEDIVLVPSEASALPPAGAHVTQELDWDRRYGHMRVHTALHLLSVAVPFGVTGGQISAAHGRLDFDMPDAPQDKGAIEEQLNEFGALDARVSESWITSQELAANPQLVKTMAVQPPKGAGDIRLIRIGEEGAEIDLQPCGGTHVARTGEIGALRIGKVEKKGRMNRRIYVHLDS
ncbi:MAG: alanyl-tRNA editing protein [Sulfitobacter sp.]|nr:alanyl-tRNA editing protein [Sulfitobacter sp.]